MLCRFAKKEGLRCLRHREPLKIPRFYDQIRFFRRPITAAGAADQAAGSSGASKVSAPPCLMALRHPAAANLEVADPAFHEKSIVNAPTLLIHHTHRNCQRPGGRFKLPLPCGRVTLPIEDVVLALATAALAISIVGVAAAWGKRWMVFKPVATG